MKIFKNRKLDPVKTIFVCMAIAFSFYAVPTAEKKEAVKRLTLYTPVEDTGGVRFSWAGGEIGQLYSIWGRIEDTDTWEEVERNLPPAGSFYLPGFRLRDNWEYRIQITEEVTEGGPQYMYFNSSKIKWFKCGDYDQNKRGGNG